MAGCAADAKEAITSEKGARVIKLKHYLPRQGEICLQFPNSQRISNRTLTLV